MTDPVSEFLDAMGAAGIRPVEPIADKLAAGDPVRFRADGDQPGRRNGWAWLHLDGVPAGVFRHYRLGVRTVWRAGSDGLDAALIQIFTEMPHWKPATDVLGRPVEEAFEFTVGKGGC